MAYFSTCPKPNHIQRLHNLFMLLSQPWTNKFGSDPIFCALYSKVNRDNMPTDATEYLHQRNRCWLDAYNQVFGTKITYKVEYSTVWSLK
jgi:hypothetical protein